MADTEAMSAKEVLPSNALPIEQLAEFVPGALLRYRVFPDGTDRIEHMSRGCVDIWEISAAELLEDFSSMWGMVDPRDLEGLGRSIAEAGKLMVDWSHQWRIITPSGVRKWLHGVGRPVAQADGSILWHSFILDVTNNQQTTESLLASEQRFRELLDGIPNVAVQGYDADLVCRYWNQASERLYGYSAQEAVGANLLDLIIPSAMHQGVLAATDQMLLSNEAIPAGELVLQRKDGSAVPVYSSHVLLQRDGHAKEFFCIDYDLTERQTAEDTRLQLQSQLRESQKMEALGTLAGGVAHDFNNIVAAILGNVDLALDDVPVENPARTSLQEIRKAGRRARDLVQQILAFSRRQDNTREPTCLRTIVAETHLMLRATLPSDLTLAVHVDPALPAVMANATQIQQVVLNLATNALQAVQGRPGASVQIRLERIEQPDAAFEIDGLEALSLRDEWPGTGACLKVIDNGSGIARDTLGRIFEPFFTTKAIGSGTGLGLAVVHGILREHGAALRVASQPGVGTVFTAVFPGLPGVQPDAIPAPTPQAHAPGRPWGDGPAPHVMYVDDEEANTFLVQRLLERDGYRVSVYNDPLVALASMREGPQDVSLCITDFNMPGMSGLRLAREMKALHPTLKVAIASGYINDELRMGAPDAGVDEVIFKPDTVEALCAAIERLLK
jgi:PAS domain S-box-containing protein